MSSEENTPTGGAEAADMENAELARLLHIDEDNEAELQNAQLYRQAAEEFLANAGVAKDYSSGQYKNLVIVITARQMERPDALTKFSDMPGSGLVAMIANLRAAQAVKEAGGA